MEVSMIQEAAGRIRQMERVFDVLREMADRNPAAIFEDAAFREMLRSLVQYYEGGQWRKDYQLDEMGLLPQDLRRGVLAQDAVYDFLDQLKPYINISE